jgi:DNA gyrase/topoisomerase IV subunit A
VIDEPDVSIDELLEIIPGPDFPHRRHHLRPQRHPPRLSHRPGTITLRARPRSKKQEGPLPDRRSRDPYQQFRDA